MNLEIRLTALLGVTCLACSIIATGASAVDPDGNVELTGGKDFDAWKKPTGDWTISGGAELKAGQTQAVGRAAGHRCPGQRSQRQDEQPGHESGFW